MCVYVNILSFTIDSIEYNDKQQFRCDDILNASSNNSDSIVEGQNQSSSSLLSRKTRSRTTLSVKYLDEDDIHIPQIIGDPYYHHSLLNREQLIQIFSHLPLRLHGRDLLLTYTSDKDGWDVNRLYEAGYSHGPSLMFIEIKEQDLIIGCE